MKKRLFLFAGYDKDNMIGPSLLLYVRTLAQLGDVVFVADSDISASELRIIEPYTVYREANSHGEYDFGSYKRGIRWAKGNLSLSDYDFLYLVNDSVFGPLADLNPVIAKMENLGLEAFSLVYNNHRRNPHMQSWFVGLAKPVFTSSWFYDFLMDVRKLDSKEDVCVRYETGLTELLVSHGIECDGLFRLSGKSVYNSVRRNYEMGVPFVKKSSFTRHNGSLGAQLRHVLNSSDDVCRRSVLEDASRLFGHPYMEDLLAGGRIVMVCRYLKYLVSKIL